MKLTSSKNYQRAYLVIVFAVITEALAFILRVGSGAQIQTLFFAQNHIATAAERTATVLAAPFLGFSIALVLISPFLDWLGMKRVVLGAALLFVTGTLLTVLAPPHLDIAFNYLRLGAFLTGLGWGSIEAVLNPLVTSLYPQDKVRRLSKAHAWWPAGIILGGILCFLCDQLEISFQIKTSFVFIPAILFGFLCLTISFPQTERVKLGVSNKDMFLELFRRPSFLLWIAIMMLGSLTELGASSFVDLTLTPMTRLFGVEGIWILIYVALVMFLMRRNAGIFTVRASAIVVLWISMLLATIGLLGLSFSKNFVMTLFSATFWGMGASLIWPTMMANVSYRYPKGGSFFLGLLGLSSCLTVWLALPQLGSLYDAVRIEVVGEIALLQQLSADSPVMQTVIVEAAAAVFQTLASLTITVIVLLSIIWLGEKYWNNKEIVS